MKKTRERPKLVDVAERLDGLEERADSMKLLDTRIAQMAEAFGQLRAFCLWQAQAVLPQDSAAERILAYFQEHVGIPISRSTIEVVAGISEYPRRIREWRVEFGWPIERLRNNHYVLLRSEPQADKAELWKTLNGVRRLEVAARDRALALFRALPHTVVTTKQLRYVIDGKDMRRIRELRTEHGWRILTRKTGRPDLKNGQYILVDDQPAEPHDRQIPDKVVIAVFERDDRCCRKAACGWPKDGRLPGDKRQYLEVHHAHWHVEKGPNVADNLITLCNVHHREVHSNGLKAAAFFDWLDDPS